MPEYHYYYEAPGDRELDMANYFQGNLTSEHTGGCLSSSEYWLPMKNAELKTGLMVVFDRDTGEQVDCPDGSKVNRGCQKSTGDGSYAEDE